MKTLVNAKTGLPVLLLGLLATAPAGAQTPVDESGEPVGTYESTSAAPYDESGLGNEDIPLLTSTELAELVGPIALYPDDLLAIVLPATAYPLQIMEAERFLAELEEDSSLKPDPEWDDSVVALLNYPEVIELLNEDMDWTWRLGEAVVAQQADVITAVETFRDRAYAAGNLKTDEYQTVSRNDGHIEITPVSEEVIYVPYYEPERVVVYQPRPVYYYYPRAYPVYYYPYSSAHYFNRGYFWGVTTAFTMGWYTNSLHVYHHSYRGHPYYGRSYRDNWWYRRPSINIYNTTYVRNTNVTVNRYYNGDVWRPRHNRRDYVRNERVVRNRLDSRRQESRAARNQATRSQVTRRQEPIRFKKRSADQRRHARETLTRNEATRRQESRNGQARKVERQGTRNVRRQVQPKRSEQRREPVVRQQREQRREPVVRQQREQRREPVVRQQREQRREPVVRQQREQRREPVVRQQREQRREPVVRQQREQRREPVVRQERRQAPVRQPAKREAKPVERKTAQRQESRRSENRSNRAERKESRSNSRARR